ncbi:MAG: hypothetical protein ACOY4Q_04680 [Bacillota bacterium]
MKKIRILVAVGMVSALLVSGCADAVKGRLPFLNKEKPKTTVQEAAYKEKDIPKKTKAETDKEVAGKIHEMVEKIRKGDWNGAITVGESAYGLDPQNEPMLEVLTEAYDFKNHLEGLSAEEKKNYIKVARAHMNLDPVNRFKKHALARVLIEVGELTEGNKLALEAYNMGPDKPTEIMDTYGWGLWLANKKTEAAQVYTDLYNRKPTTLFQLYRAGVVMETVDRAKSIIMHHTAIMAADMALTWEENKDNLSAVSLITKIRNDAEKEEKRLMAGGNAIDSNFSLAILANIRPDQYPLR